MSVLYSCTEALRDAARKLEQDTSLMAGLETQTQDAVHQAANTQGMTPAALREVSSALRAARGPCLHELLQGCRATLPEP